MAYGLIYNNIIIRSVQEWYQLIYTVRPTIETNYDVFDLYLWLNTLIPSAKIVFANPHINT